MQSTQSAHSFMNANEAFSLLGAPAKSIEVLAIKLNAQIHQPKMIS